MRAVSRVAHMRYRGQGHEIEIALPGRALEPGDAGRLAALFEDAYRAQFARAVPGMTIEVLNWAVRIATRRAAPTPLPRIATSRAARSAGQRLVVCDRTGIPVTMAVYRREALRPGDMLSGPALVVEAQTTTLVSVGFDCGVDAGGNLVLTRINTREAAE